MGSDGTIPDDTEEEFKAGPYGHINCDTPFDGLADILAAVKAKLKK